MTLKMKSCLLCAVFLIIQTQLFSDLNTAVSFNDPQGRLSLQLGPGWIPMQQQQGEIGHYALAQNQIVTAELIITSESLPLALSPMQYAQAVEQNVLAGLPQYQKYQQQDINLNGQQVVYYQIGLVRNKQNGPAQMTVGLYFFTFQTTGYTISFSAFSNQYNALKPSFDQVVQTIKYGNPAHVQSDTGYSANVNSVMQAGPQGNQNFGTLNTGNMSASQNTLGYNYSQTQTSPTTIQQGQNQVISPQGQNTMTMPQGPSPMAAGSQTNVNDQTPSSENLQPYRGQVFGMLKPENWQVNETRSGIDIYEPSSAGLLDVSGVTLVGAMGQTDPFQAADWAVTTMMGLQIQNVVGQQSLPAQTGIGGEQWQRGLKEYIVSKGGQSLHLLLSVGVQNGYGQFNLICVSMCSPASLWVKWSSTLRRMAESFQILNLAAVGGVAEQSRNLPKNNPLDSSAIMSSWENKNRSEDRNSQHQQEATMGYQRGQSETTGQSYDMPLSSYDATAGGYRNPDKPEEILNTDDNR